MSMKSLGSFSSGPKYGSSPSDARAEEQRQRAAFVERDPAPPPFGHRAHRRRARARADHQQARARMIGHQERRAVRSDDLHLIAFGEIAEVIRSDARDGLAVVILGDALHGERQVVVARPLALARARDRIQAHVMRPARCVDARRQDADRLALEHGKRGAAEIEDDVPDVGARAVGGETEVAGDRRDRGLFDAVEIDVRMRGRPRRQDVAALARRRDRSDPRDVRRRFGHGAGRRARPAPAGCPSRTARRACTASRGRPAASCRWRRSGRARCTRCRSCTSPRSTT